MDDGDSLGDLSAVMGDDYEHGYAVEDGDPNIKPKPPPPPSVQDASKVDQTKITLRFPQQKQFLTKLAIQCLPADTIAGYDPDLKKCPKPFDAFKPEVGRTVQAKEPTTDETVTFEGLTPGTKYIFRLVATNPAGKTNGKPSKPFYTLPATPPAPEFAYASAKSVSIKFPAQGQGITKLGIEMAVWCSDPFGAANKKKGLLTDTSKNIGIRTTGLVRNLLPGKPYVFRLVVSNRAGTSTGPASLPIKTLPRNPQAPREDTTLRTDTTIGLKFDRQGEAVTKLTLQYAILNGKVTFEDLAKNGGRTVTLPDAQELTAYTVKRLTPDKNYVFRLVAHNISGKSTGQILGPIKTVTFTPDMLDKSGWLNQMPPAGKKTLSRRLSSSKGKMDKFFYTIDGKLLSWAKEPNAEEVDFLHLGKVAEVTVQGNAIELKLKGAKAQSLALMGNSDDPNITSEQLMESWKEALIKAITGEQAVNEALKEAATVKASRAIASDDVLEDDEPIVDSIGAAAPSGPPVAEEEEDAGGFGGADEDEEDDAGGFEAEDEGGFGGAAFEESDEEDDAGGFGGAVEDEEEEAFGF